MIQNELDIKNIFGGRFEVLFSKCKHDTCIMTQTLKVSDLQSKFTASEP